MSRIDRGYGGDGRMSETLRGLIDSIVLTPQDGQLRVEGNLAAMLAAAQKTKRSPETGDLFVPIQVVAGGDLNPRPLGYEIDSAAPPRTT